MNKLEKTLIIVLLYRLLLIITISYFVFCQNSTGWLYLLLLTSPMMNGKTTDKH